MMLTCAGCDRPILDRFLLNVLDRAWHVKCVQCSDCNSNLTDKCFAREGKIYCRNDFFRRFGTKCAGCSQGISPSDLVRKARDKVFHLNCFTCIVCRKKLSTGEELYVLDENKFICKDDYMSSRYTGSDGEDDMELDNSVDNTGHLSDGDNSLDSKDDIISSLNNTYNNNNTITTNNNTSLSPLPQSPSLIPSSDIKEEPLVDRPDTPVSFNNDIKSEKGTNDATNSGNSSGSEQIGDTTSGNTNTPGAKRRGPRTTIKAKQLETLKAAFNATPKPTRHIREQLAQETGLNMRVIQVWFQNRRSKERRMKQLSALGARRNYFRNPRRMRAIRTGMSPHELDDSPEMMGPVGPFSYFTENGQEFYPGYQTYCDFYPGPPPPNDPLNYSHTPPIMDQSLHPNNMDGQLLPGDILPPSSTSDSLPLQESLYAHRLGAPPYPPMPSLSHHPAAELTTTESW